MEKHILVERQKILVVENPKDKRNLEDQHKIVKHICWDTLTFYNIVCVSLIKKTLQTHYAFCLEWIQRLSNFESIIYRKNISESSCKTNLHTMADKTTIAEANIVNIVSITNTQWIVLM